MIETTKKTRNILSNINETDIPEYQEIKSKLNEINVSSSDEVEYMRFRLHKIGISRHVSQKLFQKFKKDVQNNKTIPEEKKLELIKAVAGSRIKKLSAKYENPIIIQTTSKNVSKIASSKSSIKESYIKKKKVTKKQTPKKTHLTEVATTSESKKKNI